VDGAHNKSAKNEAKSDSLTKFDEVATSVMTRSKTSFEAIPIESHSETIDISQNNLVLIKFSTVVRGLPIEDCFLWPRSCRSVLQIKLFAVDLLSDIFGPQFGAFDNREIECKYSIGATANHVARISLCIPLF